MNGQARQILVTGASSGIGRAICEQRLAIGDRVTGIARNFDKFRVDSDRFTPIRLDLAQLETLPDQLADLCPPSTRFDAIVFSTGFGRFGALEEFSPAQIQTQIDVNFTSQAIIARLYLPAMKRHGGGNLIFLGSEVARSGGTRGANYSASKAALRAFAQSLRIDCAARDIAVSIINPGVVRTPFYDTLDFGPGDAPGNAIEAGDIADCVTMILAMRPGTVVDEINLSPLKRVLQRK